MANTTNDNHEKPTTTFYSSIKHIVYCWYSSWYYWSSPWQSI